MQLVHLKLLQEPEFIRLAAITDVAHAFGPGMVFADAVSRGYFDIERKRRRVNLSYETQK